MKYITRVVLILSVVSLLNDVSSEMLYPVMPVYLNSIGFTAVLIGLLEGLAGAVAGLSKGYFGSLSDAWGKRLPFVRTGYLLSAISKPMLGLFTFPVWVFSARTIDKIGKGIRTGARDAILSGETTPEHKGKVFGFHRGMDTVGAVIGPVAALLWLQYRPGDYKTMFFIAFIPGLISVAFLFLLKEKPNGTSAEKKKKGSILDFPRYWKNSSGDYKKLVGGLLAFALFNSSDFFLLLMMKLKGLSAVQVIEVYIFYNIVYALSSFPVGGLGDRIGLKPTFIMGLVLFAGVYGGMAATDNLYVYYFLFFLYGLYAAASDGITSAWITNITHKKEVATGVGAYSGLSSVFALFASVIAGFIWDHYGATATFFTAATGTGIVAIYFIAVKIGGVVTEE